MGAESHVVFAGGEEPNTFYEELPFEGQLLDPAVERVDRSETVQTQLPFSVVTPDGPTGHTPHTLMDNEVFEGDDVELESEESMEYRGRDFGFRVHDFAEAYALGDDASPTTDGYDDHQNSKSTASR